MSQEIHIAGIMIHARTEAVPAVRRHIALIPKAEIHAVSSDGKLVITLETVGIKQTLDYMDAIRALHGQPSACGTAREVGTFSHRLPADMVVANPKHREIAEKIWKLPAGTIPDKPGYHAVVQSRMRNYAMQPPIIPHKIEGYQIDKNANRCMMCHARSRTQESQAPMISVTHFMDRDGNFLAELSPRRYFCLQCHVPQANLPPLITNQFIDADTLLTKPAESAAPAKKK